MRNRVDREAIAQLIRENPDSSYEDIAEVAGASAPTVRKIAISRGIRMAKNNRIDAELETRIRDEIKEPVVRSQVERLADQFGLRLNTFKIWLKDNQLYASGHDSKQQTKSRFIQDDPELLKQELKKHEEEMRKIQERIANLEVRFERQGTNVVIHNLGRAPLVVDYRKWIQFLHQGGAQKLRGFITKEFRLEDSAAKPKLMVDSDVA